MEPDAMQWQSSFFFNIRIFQSFGLTRQRSEHYLLAVGRWAPLHAEMTRAHFIRHHVDWCVGNCKQSPPGYSNVIISKPRTIGRKLQNIYFSTRHSIRKEWEVK